MENEKFVTEMSQELTSFFKTKLLNILNPIIKEKQQTDEIFNNIPLVKELKNKIIELEEKCTEITCNKEIQIIKLKQEIKNKDKIIETLKEKINCKDNTKKITLEVKEINKTLNNENDNSKFLNENNIKNVKINNVNPFPPESFSYNQFKFGNAPSLDRVPYIWRSLSMTPSKEVMNAYPNLDWSVCCNEDSDEEMQLYANGLLLDDNNEDSEEVAAAEDKEEANEEEEVVEEADEEEEVVEEADEEEVDEEEADEEEEVVEEADEEEVVEEADEEEEASDSDEELELEEIVINEIKYLTDDIVNGTIYKCDEDGEIIEDDDGELITVGRFRSKVSELYF